MRDEAELIVELQVSIAVLAQRRGIGRAELRHLVLRLPQQLQELQPLVTDGLISGDLAVRARLDEWSLQALELGPELPTLLGSRGAALVELGRYEAGKILLAPLAAANQTRPYDSLMSQAFLAHAERALGDEAAARQFANAARTIAEAIPAAPRVMAMLARRETEMHP